MTSKLPHLNGVAPVLQFGSSFRDTSVYPNMIDMPMPGGDLHMGCFLHWSVSGKTDVCKRLTTMVDDYNVGNEWNSLIVSIYILPKHTECLTLCFLYLIQCFHSLHHIYTHKTATTNLERH